MDLQAAVGTDQFFLLYQPIFDLADMAVVGVEALLRWRHPSRGLLQPDEFIPALEASGLIIPVGRWVLLEACRQAWHGAGRASSPDVGQRLGAPARRRLVARRRPRRPRRVGLPPDDLIIEITETSLMPTPGRPDS